MPEQLACKAVGLDRSTYRRIPIALSPADPDADLRQWLRAYPTSHPCHGLRRAWAALRHDEHRGVNKKKVHRLWKEEGLRRRVHSPRLRAGMSSLSQVAADTPKVVWALDFQFDSTINSKAIKIASMLDEHTRESLLNIVERSITAERLIEELRTCFAAAGEPPLLLCCAWTTDRNSFPKHCNHFALDRSDSATSRLVLRGITATSNHPTTG